MPISVASHKVTSWEATLQLQIERVGSRSVLTGRQHCGPLVVQKPFYPEGDGAVHLLVVHPPGGIAGGDRLSIRVDVKAGAHALFTTPGAAKWYRCPNGGATQSANFHVAAGGVLEWLPQETILFDATRARIVTDVSLDPGAAFAGWDILCFGRRASGEGFRQGYFQQRFEIRGDDKIIWFEAGQLRGGDAMLTSPLGLAGHSVCGTFVISSTDLTKVPMAALRELRPGENCRYGITLLPQALVARFLGDSAEDAKAYFAGLWAMLRPVLFGRAACPPRIWRT